MKRRIIFSDDGTLNDHSNSLSNYHSGGITFSLVAADDKIFIGSDLPFNHLYIKLSSVNVETSAMTVKYWDDDQFRAVVELLDETDSGGASLAQNGFITWVPDKDYLWTRESTSHDAEEITGLTDVVIYDKYWVEISFDGDLTADVVIDWVGQIFSSDEDLYSEYPEFNSSNFKAAYESGKTTWEEQNIRAANLIAQDLQRKNVITSKEQILERDVFMPASVCKVAEMIYNAMGDDYVDQKDEARKEYSIRLNKINFKTDKNNNALLDNAEKVIKTGNFYR